MADTFRTANDIHRAPNPDMSPEQRFFEEWAAAHHYDIDRNHMCPYHSGPYTYKELFGCITADSYYRAKHRMLGMVGVGAGNGGANVFVLSLVILREEDLWLLKI